MGLLEQEPELDESKTVLEVIKEAVEPITALLAEFDAVNEAFADPDADFDALIKNKRACRTSLKSTMPGTWKAT